MDRYRLLCDRAAEFVSAFAPGGPILVLALERVVADQVARLACTSALLGVRRPGFRIRPRAPAGDRPLFVSRNEARPWLPKGAAKMNADIGDLVEAVAEDSSAVAGFRHERQIPVQLAPPPTSPAFQAAAPPIGRAVCLCGSGCGPCHAKIGPYRTDRVKWQHWFSFQLQLAYFHFGSINQKFAVDSRKCRGCPQIELSLSGIPSHHADYRPISRNSFDVIAQICP